MFNLVSSDNSMSCCGVAYMHDFPYGEAPAITNNIFGQAGLAKDVASVKKGMVTAKSSGRAVMIATTTPQQPYASEILTAAGFTMASESERPPSAGGNSIRVWTAPLGNV